MPKLWKIVVLLAVGALLVGFTRSGLDLEQYHRLPLATRLTRLHAAGQELFHRRYYEDALNVFEAIRRLDEKNLLAYFWIKKCEERMARESNEERKRGLFKQYGALIPPEMSYVNKNWGPMVGHFVIRESKPKPHVPPVIKRRPPASDEVLEQAKVAAAAGGARPRFELALEHWARKEIEAALDSYEQAVIADPDILAEDDEGFLVGMQEMVKAAMEKKEMTPAHHVQIGRIAMLQGDVQLALDSLIKGASLDDAAASKSTAYLQRMVVREQVKFLFQLPAITTFRQAYVFEDNEDRLYVQIMLSPATPHLMVPVDLALQPDSIKSIEVASRNDAFCVIRDPAIKDTTRIWIGLKDRGEAYPSYNVRLVFHLDDQTLDFLDLTNFNVDPALSDNWATVIGADASFSGGFPTPTYEKIDQGLRIAAFQLGSAGGKGPIFKVRDFRVPLPQKVDIWGTMTRVHEGTL